MFQQAGGQFVHLQARDGACLFLAQWLEDHHFVDAVEEFGAEGLAQAFHEAVTLRLFDGIFAGAKPAGHGTAQHIGAYIGGHDPDGVLRIHGVALGVGQAARIKDLQEEVEDLRMGFFNLVEQHHAVWATAQFSRQLPFLVIADIARRRADHARDGVLLHVF